MSGYKQNAANITLQVFFFGNNITHVETHIIVLLFLYCRIGIWISLWSRDWRLVSSVFSASSRESRPPDATAATQRVATPRPAAGHVCGLHGHPQGSQASDPEGTRHTNPVIPNPNPQQARTVSHTVIRQAADMTDTTANGLFEYQVAGTNISVVILWSLIMYCRH
jgi:hypothetical protein